MLRTHPRTMVTDRRGGTLPMTPPPIARVAFAVCSLAVGFADLSPMVAAEPKSSASSAGNLRRIPLATLPSTAGETVPVIDPAAGGFTVIAFLGTECPLAKVYGPRLNGLSERFADRGVRFVGVNSNQQDSMAELREYGQRHAVEFPLVKDFDQTFAGECGATRTPEVFVVNATGQVVYRGRIDDQYRPGVARAEPTVHDLRDALEQSLRGEPVQRSVTEAMGCLISFPDRRDSGDEPASEEHAVTYTAEVSRILQRHCVECHREGQIGPFSLTDFDEIVGWADMIVEVIEEGRMPPWHAREAAHPLANARSMSRDEIATIRTWVESGTPYGDAEELPAERSFLSDWMMPAAPEKVLPMSERPFPVPADGIVEYQYFVVDPELTSDRWVRGAEIRPGNRAVVHHAIAFVRPPDGGDVGRFGILAAYVPGQQPTVLPAGYARRIPTGSKIVFQMHYTPIGRPQQDITEIGLLFAEPGDVTHEVYAVGGIHQDFEIPPRAADHQVEGQVKRFPRNGELLSVMPHMHLRGKSFELLVRREGDQGKGLAETPETWLDVPAYDFNWQHNYVFADPPSLRDVESIRFDARFDNSSANPFNPDPDATVTWGDQTWEEMAVVFMDVAEPLRQSAGASASQQASASQPNRLAGADTVSANDKGANRPNDTKLSNATGGDARRVDASDGRESSKVKRRRRAGAFAERYLEKFDRDGDGVIRPDEVPDAVRLFGFRDLDRDGDGVIDRDELTRAARSRDLRP